MCGSLVQIVFNSLVALALVLTIVALATPGWSTSKGDASNGAVTFSHSNGLFSVNCSGGIKTRKWDEICSFKWNEAPGYKKTVVALLVMTIVLCTVCFIWSSVICMACCLCCLKRFLLAPLPLFCALGCIFNIAAVVLYSQNEQDAFKKELDALVTEIQSIQSVSDMKSLFSVGYSLALAAVAAAVLVVSTIVGMIMVKVSKISPL